MKCLTVKALLRCGNCSGNFDTRVSSDIKTLTSVFYSNHIPDNSEAKMNFHPFLFQCFSPFCDVFMPEKPHMP